MAETKEPSTGDEIWGVLETRPSPPETYAEGRARVVPPRSPGSHRRPRRL